MVVPVDGPARIEQIGRGLNSWKTLLDGGHLEGISGDGWFGYCDEEGKLKGLPINRTATVLARMFGWPPGGQDVLCGTIVFCGPPDKEGWDTDVPDFLTAILIKDGT